MEGSTRYLGQVRVGLDDVDGIFIVVIDVGSMLHIILKNSLPGVAVMITMKQYMVSMLVLSTLQEQTCLHWLVDTARLFTPSSTFPLQRLLP